MIWKRTRSLRSRLMVRLVLVQGIAIVVSATLGIGAIVLLYGFDRQISNPDDAHVVAEALDWDADGRLILHPTAAFERLHDEAPGFWFVAQDEHGATLSFGSVPEIYAGIASRVGELGGVSLRGYDVGSTLDAFVRIYEDGDARLHIIAGNGRLVDIIPAALQAINHYLLVLFAVLALATTAMIPWIIRREMRSVEAVAAEANMIDIDQRGMQLPTDRLPREIEPLVSAFNAALKRIDKGYMRQQRFLAAAAHELKTPIAILQTRIETLVPRPERQRLLLDVARLNNLAEQLLDVQRLEQISPEDTATDLVALTRDVVADLAPLAIAAGYEIAFDSKLASSFVRADYGAIERVVANLIQNAIAHGGGGGEIRITIDDDGLLMVADEGPGVPDQHKEDIFEPFHRVKPLNHGSGLGLSLVSDVVRLHGGHVSVADRPSGGTAFTVSLPLR
ncbi:MAG TPA: HAMP domain-containing sensor histidine kinase [Pelagibacterium sp.]|uniref:sensor histidine kinase n=1 Tax=Pelagibacterium sp. TaxID=1967288 RepID=UPI002BF55A6F|nr:HAMP domain-containing sensor histidine kinase [Pelagibacterium sp.]HWJ87341.1 HAMP domain-containing sensor histidine kinase [Pelagibacterium sp.]